MVDAIGRKRFSEALRHFGAGVMTVDKFEEISEDFLGSQDEALAEMWSVSWCSYDDFTTVRLRGHWKLAGENRKTWARMILFLQSNLEYLWPEKAFATPLYLRVLNVVLLGTLSKKLYTLGRIQAQTYGDPEVWPFLNKAEYERALGQPKFLTGHSATHTATMA